MHTRRVARIAPDQPASARLPGGSNTDPGASTRRRTSGATFAEGRFVTLRMGRGAHPRRGFVRLLRPSAGGSAVQPAGSSTVTPATAPILVAHDVYRSYGARRALRSLS